MRLGIGFQTNCRLVAGERFVVARLRPQRVSTIAIDLWVGRIEKQSALETRARLVELSQCSQRGAAIVVSGGVLGLEGDRLCVLFEGVTMASHLLQCRSQRIERENLPRV